LVIAASPRISGGALSLGGIILEALENPDRTSQAYPTRPLSMPFPVLSVKMSIRRSGQEGTTTFPRRARPVQPRPDHVPRPDATEPAGVVRRTAKQEEAYRPLYDTPVEARQCLPSADSPALALVPKKSGDPLVNMSPEARGGAAFARQA
jgi:hypothetical protein